MALQMNYLSGPEASGPLNGWLIGGGRTSFGTFDCSGDCLIWI